jgi:FtsP/CotA-like multicopper oxidase with cupredoxin domain
MGFNEGEDVYITLTNVGLVVRPDLDDSHTLHWHGFRNPNSIFDGVPEVSIAVPVARDFPFYYKPRDAGTYMYHCHFEDVEHVQMGMDGVVFVRPAGHPNWAYNDSSTEFHREFTFMLNDVWTEAHDNLASIQENIWSNYKADYWTMNGRSYPDTILRNGETGEDPTLEDSQPVSCLIQVNEGETALLRLANLGYEQYAMQLPGIRMRVVGMDATYLGSLSYEANTIYMGPGEARDVLFQAPVYNSSRAEPSDGVGPYNVYWFKNRNYQYLTNGGAPGLGGQITQVRVYPGSTPLPPQTAPNETYLNL